jgi:hypothetical protein
VHSSTGLAINVVPSFPADMSCHWKMSGMGGPSHATKLLCIYCSCHNTHRGMKALFRCADCLWLDPAEQYVCYHHPLHDSKQLIATDAMECAMRTAQEQSDAQWREESCRRRAVTAEREAEEARQKDTEDQHVKAAEAAAATAAADTATLRSPLATAAAIAADAAAPAWWRVGAGTILHKPGVTGVRKEPLMAFVSHTLKLTVNVNHKPVQDLKLPELHVLVQHWFDTNHVQPENVETVSDRVVEEQLRARFPSEAARDLWAERNRADVPLGCSQRELLKHVLLFAYKLKHCTQPRGHVSTRYKERDGHVHPAR